MTIQQHSTSTPWEPGIQLPTFEKLARDRKTEVCIVGAGIAGLSVAYQLMKVGKKVVVLEDGQIGSGQTSMTTAHLSNAIDCRYFEVERIHGAEAARLVGQSHSEAIDTIENVSQSENIECDFRRLSGYLFQPPDDSSDTIEREFAAAARTGIVEIERADRAPLPGIDTGPCLRFKNQGQFHPLKYLAGLTRAITLGGGAIYTSTHADSIEGGNVARVHTASGTVTAEAVVVATNSPINDLVALHTKQAPYITYVIAARLPAGSLECALYWDTLDPYHYVRLQPMRTESGEAFDLLIVGGEDHKSGQADDGAKRFAHLEEWARQRIPTMQGIEFNWAGQVMESIDGLAYIGRNPHDSENVYVVTGDSGQGMTHGTIAGNLIRDLILGRDNLYTHVYNPKRISLRAAGEFAKENINVAGQYASWVTPGEIESADNLGPGDAGILRSGVHKLAVYRDQAGKIHERSAVCPHLGCVVAWNTVEQTWDCPCHGSRFTAEGKVFNGPANSGLAERSAS